jgi:hypothetical protein
MPPNGGEDLEELKGMVMQTLGALLPSGSTPVLST